MLTNMKLVSDLTSGLFHTMQIKRMFPTKETSIVIKYMMVNAMFSADPIFHSGSLSVQIFFLKVSPSFATDEHP